MRNLLFSIYSHLSGHNGQTNPQVMGDVSATKNVATNEAILTN